MKRILALVVVLLATAGIWWVNRPQPVAVELLEIGRGPVELIAANSRAGTIRACRRSRLALPQGGRVANLLVDEGDRVEAGQTLLQLHNPEQQVNLQRAQVQVEAAELERQRTCQGAALAGRELTRSRGLAEQKLLSDDRLDRLATEARTQALACRLAAVRLRQAQAEQALAQVRIDEMQLQAPFAGIIAEINGELGEYTTPSPPGVATPPAVDLIDDSCLYVRAPIDEVEAARLEVGQPARITLDAFRGRQFSGTLSRIAPYVSEQEKQARTVDIDVRFDPVPKDARLLVGYSADVEVIIQRLTQQLRIPSEALLEGRYVLRLNPDTATLQRVEVSPSAANWDWTAIDAGLAVGDRILQRLDTEGAVDGARVEVR